MESKKNYSKTFNPYNAKHRNILLTLFDIDKYPKIRQYLTNLKNFQYMVAAQEKCPETGRDHIHIYCQFNKPSNVSQNKCCNAHLDVSRGTPEQNITYVKKDGNILDEIGEHKNNHKTRFVSYNDIKKMTPEQRGELSFVNANIIERFNQRDELRFRKSKMKKGFLRQGLIFVKYIWGPSGSGKSELAMDIMEGLMPNTTIKEKFWDNVHHYDGFWHGISGETEYAIYDEFRDTQMSPYKFINFIDYNVHSLNIKGGNIMNKYKYIIITSTQDPHNIYAQMKDRDEPARQWLRRMEVIHLQPLKRLDDTQAEFTRTRLRRPGVNVPDYELYWTHRITEYYDTVQYALQHPEEINPPRPLTIIESTCGTANENNNNNNDNNDIIMATASAQDQPQESVPDEEVPIIPEDIFAYGVVDDDPANYSFSWGHNSDIDDNDNQSNYHSDFLGNKRNK